MPALKNPRHEALCHLVLQGAKYGWSQADIYMKAGYRTTGHAAEVAASRLLKNDEIQNRIAELGAPQVRKTRATVDTLSQQFDVVFDGATSDRQWGAAGSAAGLKAKLWGFLREKIEIGNVGDFDGCTTEEVAARTLDEMTLDEALQGLEALKAALLAVAADRALPVAPSAPPLVRTASFYQHQRK